VKTPKKILFRGLGGAGQRHLRIIKETLPNARLLYVSGIKNVPLLNADFSINHSSTVTEHYELDLYSNIEAAYEQKPDLVIVAMPSVLLADEAATALKMGCDVLCEKPGAISTQQAKSLLALQNTTKNKLSFSYQREFHPALLELKNLLKKNTFGSIQNIRIKVSSFVPGWHPYEDYRSLYACRKALGGGVLLTEIHELFYLIGHFGLPEAVNFCAKYDPKKLIDVEQHVMGVINYPDFLCSIDLCFMQKNPERLIEVFGENGHAILDINSGRLDVSIDGLNETSRTYLIDNDQLFRDQLSKFLSYDSHDQQAHLINFSSAMLLVEKVKESFLENKTILLE